MENIRHIDIEKLYEPGKGARWVVRRDDPGKKFHRGVPVEWELHADPQDKGNVVEAHFQFTDLDLMENPSGKHQLTQDLTASVAGPGVLKLRVQEKACRRRNPRHYAVWIKDETLPGGGVFAVGEDLNPPPEIDVGGGG